MAYNDTHQNTIDLDVAIVFHFVSDIRQWFHDGETNQSKIENKKYIIARAIQDLNNNHAITKQIPCQIVLRTHEVLYQYFSHRLYTCLDANILHKVNTVVIIPDTRSNIHFSAKIGRSNTPKNVAWWEKER